MIKCGAALNKMAFLEKKAVDVCTLLCMTIEQKSEVVSISIY